MNGQANSGGTPGSNPGTGAPGAGASPPVDAAGVAGAPPPAGGASAASAAPPAADAGKPGTVLGTDDKPADGAPPRPADWAPKFPDGFQANEKDLGEFKSWVKETGVKGEAAQKLVDMQVAAFKRGQEQMAADRLQQAKDWEAELRADKDFGGDKYDANVQLARKAISQFPELKKFFAENPLGNNPAFVKAFADIGRRMGEGELKGSTTEGGATSTNSKQAFLKQLMPKSFEQMNGRR